MPSEENARKMLELEQLLENSRCILKDIEAGTSCNHQRLRRLFSKKIKSVIRDNEYEEIKEFLINQIKLNKIKRTQKHSIVNEKDIDKLFKAREKRTLAKDIIYLLSLNEVYIDLNYVISKDFRTKSRQEIIEDTVTTLIINNYLEVLVENSVFILNKRFDDINFSLPLRKSSQLLNTAGLYYYRNEVYDNAFYFLIQGIHRKECYESFIKACEYYSELRKLDKVERLINKYRQVFQRSNHVLNFFIHYQTMKINDDIYGNKLEKAKRLFKLFAEINYFDNDFSYEPYKEFGIDKNIKNMTVEIVNNLTYYNYFKLAKIMISFFLKNRLNKTDNAFSLLLMARVNIKIKLNDLESAVVDALDLPITHHDYIFYSSAADLSSIYVAQNEIEKANKMIEKVKEGINNDLLLKNNKYSSIYSKYIRWLLLCDKVDYAFTLCILWNKHGNKNISKLISSLLHLRVIAEVIKKREGEDFQINEFFEDFDKKNLLNEIPNKLLYNFDGINNLITHIDSMFGLKKHKSKTLKISNIIEYCDDFFKNIYNNIVKYKIDQTTEFKLILSLQKLENNTSNKTSPESIYKKMKNITDKYYLDLEYNTYQAKYLNLYYSLDYQIYCKLFTPELVKDDNPINNIDLVIPDFINVFLK